MLHRFATYLALFCWLPFVTMAQRVETVHVKHLPGPYLRFDQVTVNNEAFKQAYDKSLQLQDSQGYLWFISTPNATEQLIRYDGNHYKSFGSEDWGVHESDNSRSVKENERHEIWAANKNGLSLFDPITETFHSFRNPFVEQQTIQFWVMGNKGLNWFISTDPLEKLPIKPFFEFNTRTHKVRQIIPSTITNGYTKQTETYKPATFFPKAVDAQGRIWGSVNCIINTVLTVNLGYYDAATNALVWYPIGSFMAPQFEKTAVGQHFDAITDVIPDGRYIWFGSWTRLGILRLDSQTGQWKQFYFPQSDYNQVFQIIPRNDQQFWLRCPSSLALFDKNTETLYTYPHEPDNAFTPTRGTYSYTLGNNKTLWMGLFATNNAATLSVLNESKQYFKFKGSTPETFRVIYKKGRKLYCSYQSDGQLIFAEQDEVSHTQTRLYSLPLNGFTEQEFYVALPDRLNHAMWIIGKTSVGALFRLDATTRKVEPVNATIQGLPPGENQTSDYNVFLTVVQDRQGNVWFPSFGRHPGNLLKFDSRTKQFVGFQAGTHGLLTGSIRSAVADRHGLIWLGLRVGGAVQQFDTRTNRATTVLEDAHRLGTDLMEMAEDTARNLIWLARYDDGLWKYDQQKKNVQQVLREPVLRVHLTKNGMLWLKTLTALVRYNPETRQLSRFGSEYDLHNFSWFPFIGTDDGEFFFDKFRFRDQDIKPDTIKPAVVFSFVNVFDKPLQLAHSLNYTATEKRPALDLQYDQNFFSIGFSALSYFQSDHNQYAYRLDDFNKSWVNVGNKPLATFTNVPPGIYQLHIRGTNSDGLWSTVRTLKIIIHPPYWQTWWFRTLMALLFVGLLYSVYRSQVERRTLRARLEAEEAKRKQKEAELSEKEAAFKLKISETEMAALRSQMNPHFIFNCLNSIQFFTAQNNAEKASEYLTKFSRLIRLVLENSKSDKVTLANELETLQLYIDMEAMRFQQKVHYVIDVNDEIDPYSVQIPPLLLQPFVENAIWHGLMHKDEGGTVWIDVQQIQEDQLHIEITDDGIGRIKAAEYKSKSATKNKSFGMKLTAERIELINQLYHTQTQIEVVDLVDTQGLASGTRVIVDIPI